MSATSRPMTNNALRMATTAALCVGAVLGRKNGQRTMDLCTSYDRVCTTLTDRVDCTAAFDNWPAHRVVSSQGCLGITYDTYVGQCQCSGLDAGAEVLRELVDYSIEKGVDYYYVPGNGYEMEACGTFEKVCGTFLGGVKCPTSLRINTGCSMANDLSTYVGDCMCGSMDMSKEVTGIMVTNRITPDLVALPATSGKGTNVCSSFMAACGDLLDDVGCPTNQATNVGCTTANSTETFAGQCLCGKLDASSAVTAAVTRKVTEGAVLSASLAVSAAAKGDALDYCTSYTNLCTAFLNKADCPVASHVSKSGCVGKSGTNLATFRPQCSCGSMDVSAAVTNLLIESQIAEDVDELVCIGDGCSAGGMTAGKMAMIVISIVLAAILTITFLYIKGEPIVRRALAHPCFRRLGQLNPFAKPWPLKSSPATTDDHDDEHYPRHA